MNGKYLYFALAALLGVLTALVTFLPFLLLAIFYFCILYTYKRFKKVHLVVSIGVFILFLGVGHRAELFNKTIIPESTSTFNLEYTQLPKIDGALLQIEAIDITFKEKLLIRYPIKSKLEKENLIQQNFFQRQCRVSGTMTKPKIAKNPNAFDYRHYLAARNIYWIVEVNMSLLKDCTKVKPSFLSLLKQLRYTGILFLEKHFPADIASLSAALIFGDRTLLDPNLLSDYQQTGIVHLLAISGLHVSLLIGMFFYLGIRFGMTREYMTVLLLVLLPVYVVLTGASPSVIRAALMIFLVLLTIKFKAYIKLMPIDAISLAFMLYLFVSPTVLFDAGFQLSFSVSGAIILAAPHILGRYKDYGLKMLVTSITAQLAALPFLLYHFFELSLIGILANMLYIPLFSFIYLPGLYLLFIIQLLFGTSPDIIIQFFLKTINLSNEMIAHLSDFRFLSFIPGRPNSWEMFIYIGITFFIFYLWELKDPRKQIHLLTAIIVLFAFQPICSRFSPVGEVTMIDVGQGDSILIHLPHDKGNYLIDTGGTMSFHEEPWRRRTKPYEVGRDTVVPFLKGKGITRIDKLILTHGDMDHIGGSLSIIEALDVKEIILPAVIESSETEREIIIAANKKGIPVIRSAAGDRWSVGENQFYIVNPKRNYSGERNSGSLTIVAYLGGLSWFLGGDLDQAGEEKILKSYPHLTVDVLKAGHHGSKTSSADGFIRQIKPKIALISAGEKNRFGHPHNEVLKKLEQQHTKIYRTDLNGAVTYRFYHRKGTFSTYLP
ncbi:DNA internalization-related competence protein ComEC/Rec2 [Neobacillus mesonae]|uniref:DNA internalization-related competence protein ComEC/Rec2 n=1 Tax=Neobacillus mesonae TaxID=1193713 RepID=UPI002E1F084C|nr:DNA internalization-related competence protein ComEC/Rec2 [Neobacillus mesonae]MED4204479.1 DNA internalization-related competence protein ComEC/Rec2 [Neobacillus mesonae]